MVNKKIGIINKLFKASDVFREIYIKHQNAKGLIESYEKAISEKRTTYMTEEDVKFLKRSLIDYEDIFEGFGLHIDTFF